MVKRASSIREAVAVAGLLWLGVSGALPGEAGAGAVHLVSTRSDPPDLAAYERRVEGVRRGLAALDRIEGSYGDRSVSYVAFLDGDLPVAVAEQWDLGQSARGEAIYHFMHGDLLRYRSFARGLSSVGAPSDGWYERTMTVYFEPGRFVAGTGTINGRPAEPDEHEVRAAWRQAEAVKARVAAARAANVPVADSNHARYACADGSAFAVTFDVAGARAVIEFLGREPIVLPRVEAGSSFVYGDDRYRLRGEGEEAFWEAGGLAPVPCTLAASSTPLRLAPGNYPLFDPAAKPADDWSRLLFDLMSAIDTCLREPVGDLPRVIKAWPINHGMVGVRLQNIDGGRHQCIAAADGSAVDQVELLGAEAERAPGKGNPIFTPAAGAYPGGACFSHERVETADGRFLGWVSARTC
jgi:membrane-bound inhibitor of C-type lysozyme